MFLLVSFVKTGRLGHIAIRCRSTKRCLDRGKFIICPIEGTKMTMIDVKNNVTLPRLFCATRKITMLQNKENVQGFFRKGDQIAYDTVKFKQKGS